MPHFEWSISLGNILTTLFLLLSFIGGAYKFVYNHMEHLAAEMRAALRAHEEKEMAMFAQRFDAVDKDIRELRDWTIVMRGSTRTTKRYQK